MSFLLLQDLRILKFYLERKFSILGAKKELISGKKLPIGWKVSEKLIPPQCFSTEWMSSDNYEEFVKKFGIKNYKDFLIIYG